MSAGAPGPRPLVLAGPSGTGKTTLARRLVEGPGAFRFSVSATTREARPAERDGRDYHFVDRARFEAMVAAGELAEWAEVHGELYGTPRSELDAAAREGCHVVLDIDVQGARQIRASAPDALLVFVLPPSVDALVRRLIGRGTEAEEKVARRLRTALEELEAVAEFDQVVVNEDLETCLGEIRELVARDGQRPALNGTPRNEVEEMRVEIARILREHYANVRA